MGVAQKSLRQDGNRRQQRELAGRADGGCCGTSSRAACLWKRVLHTCYAASVISWDTGWDAQAVLCPWLSQSSWDMTFSRSHFSPHLWSSFQNRMWKQSAYQSSTQIEDKAEITPLIYIDLPESYESSWHQKSAECLSQIKESTSDLVVPRTTSGLQTVMFQY